MAVETDKKKRCKEEEGGRGHSLMGHKCSVGQKVSPASWVGAMSWLALDGRMATGAGGEVFSTTSIS